MKKDINMEDVYEKMILAGIITAAVTGISYMIHMGSDVTRQAYYSDWYLNLVQNAYQIPM